MTQAVTYEDAVDLLEADHKAVKKLFMDFNVLCEDGAAAADKQKIAARICQELTAHAQIEEEIFYPRVREAVGDDALMDEALQEHAEAKETIARIQGMDAGDKTYDETVGKLGKLIDGHVLEEREKIFLRARNAALDLRGMALELSARRQQLQGAAKPTAAAQKKEKVAA